MTGNKATIIGATGLIGSHLLELLKTEDYFDEIKILVRRKINHNHIKVKVAKVDFDDRSTFQNEIIKGSVIFCAVGTTNKKVKGNKTQYRKVDYDIPLSIAECAIQKDCKQFILISSLGANSKSSNFYTKMKGEVEHRLNDLNIYALSILRPSLLLGKREEFRFREILSKLLMKTFSFLIPSNLKPIKAKDVAKAMLMISQNKKRGTRIYHNKDIWSLIH